MAVRVNKAKKFNGKSYVGTDALDTLIQSIAIEGNTLTLVGADAKVEGDAVTAKTISLSGLTSITNSSVTLNGVATDLITDTNNTFDATGLTQFIGATSASRMVSTDANGKLDYTLQKATEITSAVNDADHIPTVSAVKTYVDGKSINVAAGNGVEIITSNATGAGSLLNPLIKADVDGTTIVFTGATDGAKKLATDLKLKKKTTANSGAAASYYLAYGDSTTAIGVDIDIFKDQFLKDAVFGWANGHDSSANNFAWNATKTGSYTVPTLRFDVYTYNQNDNDDSSGDADALYKSVYVDCTSFYNDYVGSSGVDITNNVVKGVVDTTNSETVYTAKNTSAAVLTVGENGFKVANIQAAIDNAVTAEHVAASAAIETLESQVSSFETATNTAVGALNTRIETVATNAVSAINVVSAAVSAVDSKVDAKIDAVNNNVETAIGAVINSANTAISGSVDAINAKVSAVASGLNSRIGVVAGNAETTASALEAEIVALDTKVDGAFSALDTAIETAIDAVQTSVTTHTANAVQMIEVTSTPTLRNGTSGVYETTQTANNIVAVYCSGIQIYPEISRTGATAPYTYTLEADYGSAQSQVESWTVLYTVALSSYTGVDVDNTTYDVTASAAKTVGGGTAVDYSNATASTANAPTFTKADYETTTIGAIAVGNGTAATAPAVNADVTKVAPDYRPAP